MLKFNCKGCAKARRSQKPGAEGAQPGSLLLAPSLLLLPYNGILMRVGMIGTGAISHKHAEVYQKIGYKITVCTDIFPEAGRKFAEQYGAEFVPTYQEVCRHPKVDYVDVCTFPNFRLEPIEICAESKKHVQVQKPIATSLDTAR